MKHAPDGDMRVPSKAAVLLAIPRRFLASALLLTAMLLSPLSHAQQVCGLPGNDPGSTVSGIVNSYFDGSNQATLATSATSLRLGAVRAGSANSTVAIGDLLIVMQMQDGVVSGVNSANYGSGTGNGKGTTSIGNAGLYEFVRATSAGGANTVINFTPALTNNYSQAAATTSLGQRRYQVIRVPQYAAVTLSGVTAPAWDGLTGGVVAIDSSQVLTLGSGTVEGQANRAVFLGGKGFRGAVGYGSAGNSPNTDWVLSDSTNHAHGGKAEGIAGTPRYVAFKNDGWGFQTTGAVTSATLVRLDNGVNGYPNGDRARGAPGNAGGGGTDGGSNNNQYNAGGGGGGNYAEGGLGGRPFNRPLIDSNGRGGAAYASVLDFNRVFLGGGGGGGGTNNAKPENAAYENQAIACAIPDGGNGDTASARCSSGAAGGGIAILRARSVTGSGIIDVRGGHAYNVGNDAGGGGGGAGAAVLHVIDGGAATVSASGGDGGNAWAGRTGNAACGDGIGTDMVSCRHGPGGGGSGGFIAFSPAALAITADLAGGTPGRTTNGPSDTYEANGLNGGLSTFLTPDVPGVVPGALCFPDLRLGKTNGLDVLLTSGSATYSLTVSNLGAVPSSGLITVVDVLPPQLSVADGVVAVSGAQAANWNCTASSNVLTCTSSAVIGASSTSTFAFTANISASDGSAIVNRGRVGGGGDPDNAPPTPVNTATCSADNVPAGCAIDADVTNAPFLALAKSSSAFVAGNSGSYTLTVTNIGSQPSSGTIRIVDVLPAGVTFASFSSPSGFTCTSTPPNVVCSSTTAIAVGATATITVNVNVAAAAPGSLTNRARVGGGGDPVKPGLPANDGSTTTTCPAPIPPATSVSNSLTGCAAVTDPVRSVNLSLSKTDGQNFMPVNGQTTYQFTVSNSGNAASIGTISFADELPTPMTWPAALTVGGPNAANWACVRVDADSVTCSSSASIPVGGSSTFSLIANVGAILIDGTNYTNKARIGGGGDPDLLAGTPTPAQVTACTGNNVAPGCALDLNVGQSAAQIRLAKSHPDPQAHNPGDAVTFNLVASNSGASNSSATIVVVDVLPVGVTYSGAASFTSGGFACVFTAAPAPGFLTCTRASMNAGTSATISYSVTINNPVSNAIVNRAEIGGGGDPQNGTIPTATSAAQCNGSGSPSLGCAIDPVPLNADLGISKLQCQGGACGVAIGNYASSIAPVLTGTPVRFFLRVSNAGPSGVINATISDSVPSNFTALSIVAVTPGGSATCSAANFSLSGNMLTGTIPSLPNGGSCDIVISGTASTAGNSIPNTATVIVPNGIIDSIPGNNSSTVTTTIIDPVSQLTLTKTSSAASFVVGVPASYTLSVQNTGTAATTGPSTITDTIPTGLTIGVLPAGCGAILQVVTCTIPSGLAVSATTSFVIPVTPTSAAQPSVTNTATVSGGGDPTCPAASHCSDSEGPTPVNAPVLTITKTASASPWTVGVAASYTLIVQNTGTAATTAVATISDTIPTGLTIGALPAGCGAILQIVTCTIPSGLVVNATANFVIPVTPTNAAQPSVTNTATVSGGGDPTCPAASHCSDSEGPTPVNAPVLTTTKVGVLDNAIVAPNDQSNPGDTIAYTVTVANSGNGAATGVTVNDPLVALTCTIAGNPVSLPTTLAAGANLICTGTYTLVASDITIGSVGNTATTGGTNVCNPTTAGSTCSDTTTTPLDRVPVLTTNKVGVLDNTIVAPNDQSNPGDTIAYTVTVANSGNGAAIGVTVTDPLIALTCTIAGNPVTLPTPLAAGASLICTGTYTLIASDIASGSVSNTATTGGTNVCDPTTAGSTCSGTTTTPLDRVPVLTTTKSGVLDNTIVAPNDQSNPGDTIAYSVTVANSGNGEATGVTVNDPLIALTCTIAGNPVSLPTTLAAGANLICTGTYTLVASDITIGSVSNTATTGGSNVCDPMTTGSTCSTTVVTPLDRVPVLTTTKSGVLDNTIVAPNDQSNPGDTIAYSVTVANSGNGEATGVTVNDPLVALTCTIAGNPVSLPTTLAAGANLVCSGTYTLVASDITTGSVSNTATTGGTNVCDPTTAGSTCSGTTTTPLDRVPVLTTSKSGVLDNTIVAPNDQSNPGDTIAYTVTVANSGNGAATGVTVNDPLVALTCTIAGNPVALPTPLAAGANLVCTGTYTLVASDITIGSVSNTATTGGSNVCDPTTTGSTCSTTVVTPLDRVPVLTITKTASASPWTVGVAASYTLTVANIGTLATTAVSTISDPIPAGLTIGALPVDCAAAGQIVTCTIATGLATGASVSFIVPVTPTAAAQPSVTNTASVFGGGDPTCVAAGDCTSTVTTPFAARISISKELSVESGTIDAVAEPGEALTYTITLTNSGGVAATNYGVTDPLDVNTTFVSATNGGTEAAGVVTWSGLTVPADGELVLTVVANVNTPIPAGVTRIRNLAYQTGTTPPACPGADPACVVIPTVGNVTIAKALTGETGTQTGIAEPGEELTYTITLINSGGVAVTGFGVTDSLDANTSFLSADNLGANSAGIVTWMGLTVPANGNVVLTVVVTVNNPIPVGLTHVANLVYESGTTPPSCTITSGPQCVVTPTAPNISATKALSGESINADGIAEPGEELTYTITVRNDGGAPTTATIVNESVPLHTTYVSGTPTWTCNPGDPGGTACVTLVNVPAHDGVQPGVVTLVFTVKVDDPLADGVTSITNAVVLDDGIPPDCVALPSQPGCVVVTTGNLKLIKTVASVIPTGPSSHVVSYLIEVSNVGGSAQIYTLTDTLAFPSQGVLFTGNASVTTVGGTLNPALVGGQFAPVNGTIVQLSDSAINLAAGAIHRYTVKVPVGVQPANLQAGACTGVAGNGYFNQAGVTGLFTLESAACAPVNGDVALIRLVKMVTLGQDANANHYGDVGDVLNYTFTISNPGSVALTTVQLFDPRVTDLQCNSITQLGAPIRVLYGDELFSNTFESLVIPGILTPGDSVDCHATYALTANDVARRQVLNSATTTASGPAGQAVSSTATAIYTSFR